MAELRNKSNQEIGWMLDEYGIKHGPVVDSTRGLYEKKLSEAMAKERRSKPHLNRTYCREEEEEVSHISHRKPLRYDGFEDRTNPVSRYRNLDTVDEPAVYHTQAPYRSTFYARDTSSTYETQREPAARPSSERFVPLWLQILLFLIVAGVLVFVFLNTEVTQMLPFKRLL